MNFNIEWFLKLFPTILPYIPVTFRVSFISLVLGVILAAIIAIIRYYKISIFTQCFGFYITFFRATPLIVQLFFLYFGLPCVLPLMRDMSAEQATIIVLVLNASAFLAETFRAALMSVDKSQIEACYSMGMSRYQTMTRAVIPQAFVIALPSIVNEFISIIKGTALGFTVGLLDIMAIAKMEGTLDLRFFESYLCVMIIYIVIVVIIANFQKILERKVEKLY